MCISDYVADVIESVQKRALKIVFPAEESYTEALGQANLPTLQDRRENLCCKYMEKMKSRDHPLFKLLPKGLLQVLVITSSEKTRRNFFYLMAQLLVGPREQIFFFYI